MTYSPIWTDLDWERPGRQDTFLCLEHSVHRAAMSIVQVPISVLANGDGPTVLLMGGVHGDEYEGQVALTRLLADLDITRLQGRLIVMPAVNLPAAVAGMRTSPLDGGNLNRAFSPTAADSPTVRIARYLSDVIFPLCDWCFDCHTAGETADHFPAAYATLVGDVEKDRAALQALTYINAPLSWGQPVMDGPFSEWVAIEHGIRYFGSEFGGCGHLRPQMLWHAERSIYRLLDHAGVYPLAEQWSGENATRWITGVQESHVYATCDGVFLPQCEMGTAVRAGETGGYLYTPELPLQAPTPVDCTIDGILTSYVTTGRVRRGDLVLGIMRSTSPEELLSLAKR
jgi:predicted deacylase